MRAAGIPRPPWVTAAPARSASSDVVIMYRPGTVPAPMPETGACDCGSAGASGHNAQSANTGPARATTNRSQSHHEPSGRTRIGHDRWRVPEARVRKRGYTVQAPSRSRPPATTFPRSQRHESPQPCAGMGGRIPARQRRIPARKRRMTGTGGAANGGAAAPGHLVAFGSTGSPGPAKPGTPGRAQLRRLANGESVGG